MPSLSSAIDLFTVRSVFVALRPLSGESPQTKLFTGLRASFLTAKAGRTYHEDFSAMRALSLHIAYGIHRSQSSTGRFSKVAGPFPCHCSLTGTNMGTFYTLGGGSPDLAFGLQARIATVPDARLQENPLCPHCEVKTWGHGWLSRLLDDGDPCLVHRFKCPKYQKTISCLPDSHLPSQRFAKLLIISALVLRLVYGRWPPDIPRQRGGYWLK